MHVLMRRPKIMPRNRWMLPRSKKSEYSRAVERMRAAGADLTPFDFECPWVRVTHCPIASGVRTWTGASVFVVHIRMVGLAPKVIVQGFDLSSPEWDSNSYVLDDPAVGNSAQQLYRMLDGSRFHRSEVLNHRVDAEGILRYGDVIEGLVLAECFSSVPTRYNQWNLVPLAVSIVNQFDDVCTFPFELPVEQVSIHRRPRRSGSLFEPAGGTGNGSVLPAADHLVARAIASREVK
jgi:hypothetical protein